MKIDSTTHLRRLGYLLMWIFPLLLIIPNCILSLTESYTGIAKIVNVVLPLGIYFWVMSLSKNVGRTVLLLIPIELFASVQIVLLYLYGDGIISVDMFLNLVATNASEASELLGNLFIAILVIVVIYVPSIVTAIVLAARKIHIDNTKACKEVGIYITATGALLLLSAYIFVPGYKVSRQLFPANTISNMFEASSRFSKTQDYHHTAQMFSFGADSGRDKEQREIYVLVIGETSRCCEWQLFGYERPTNPLLVGDTVGGLIPYPYAVSESNITHKSVPLIMSHLTAETFGDSIYETKSIITAFNEAGYSTAFFSNQRPNHSFIDFFGHEADVVTYTNDKGRPLHDEELLPLVDNYIRRASNHKLFIVLHTMGSHFNYRERYTDEDRYFEPDNASDAKPDNRADLINAYDNTIRYTDKVLHKLIERLAQEDCVSAMIYLSDHGEDIFDDERKRILHSSPTPTYYQLHVPLLLWCSDSLQINYPELVANARRNADMQIATSQTVFPTLLQLADISTKYVDEERSVVSENYTEPQRVYLNDYNEATPLEKSGIKEQDVEKFKQKHLMIE